MQYINGFMNRLYRKEIKDKHKIAIEKLEFAYTHPLSYPMQPYKHPYVCAKYAVLI